MPSEKVKVFDNAGVERWVYPCDAREILENGGSEEAPPAKTKATVKSEVEEDGNEEETLDSLMEKSKAELLEQAESLGLELPSTANKQAIAEAILDAE